MKKYADNNNRKSGRNERASVEDRSDFGDAIRPIDREQQTDSGKDFQLRAEPTIGFESDSTTQSRGNSAALPNGFYFTPNGDIARIPDGHYINAGRLRKRRRGSDRSNSAGRTADSGGAETSEQSFVDSEVPLRDVKSTGRKQKKVTEAQQRVTMVAMISVACTAMFSSITLLTKHDHWSLEQQEAKYLAEAVNEAIQTLPTKTYAAIIAIIERWIPWVNLVFVVSAIIIPRIEASAKRIEDSHYKENPRTNSGNAGAKADTPYSYESIGNIG